MQRVLVIDDDPQSRYLMAFILQNAGYEVTGAAGGEEGLELAAKKTPDLILMDIRLPGMDGYETVTRIQAAIPEKKIPVIAITASALAGDRERALAAGFTGSIEKPINPTTVIDEIDRILAGPGG